VVRALDVPLAQRLHQAHEPEQRKVGVSHLAQRVSQSVTEDVVQRIGQPGQRRIIQERIGPSRIGKPQPGQPTSPTGWPGGCAHRPNLQSAGPHPPQFPYKRVR
jgi:hypothetical protein